MSVEQLLQVVERGTERPYHWNKRSVKVQREWKYQAFHLANVAVVDPNALGDWVDENGKAGADCQKMAEGR